MAKNFLFKIATMLFAFSIMLGLALAQEDKVVRAAIETFRSQVRLPPDTQIKFFEKKESPIPGFYSVKLYVVLPDKEMPAVLYVDKAGEKVFLGNLFIKGQNVTMKEAGAPIPKKIDMGTLDTQKSPFIGNKTAKVTIVEFSNFQCPYCMDSWQKLQRLMEKHPKEIKYIFKHFPFQPEGKTFELSEMAAAAQEISNDAFWVVHDFLFTQEGQSLAQLEKEAIKLKIEQLLKGSGYDIKIFQTALETRTARKRVEDDMALGRKIRVSATPTKIINGDIHVGSGADNVLERYLGK
jgi:protein-disulfide isomerase